MEARAVTAIAVPITLSFPPPNAAPHRLNYLVIDYIAGNTSKVFHCCLTSLVPTAAEKEGS